MKSNNKFPRLIISAPHSGTGKTTLTMGIMSVLKHRGLCVQPYKVGPDYIDPEFHRLVTNRPSINLDGWILEDNINQELFIKYSKDADISIIEGVMGLYDGYMSEPMIGSTAHISKLIDAPVILVMNAKGMSTSAAALVHGMISFRNINIKGIIINRPASERHYNILKNTIEQHTGVSVIGYLPKLEDVKLESRHLGLVQSSEIHDINSKIKKLSETVAETINIDKLIKIANDTPTIEWEDSNKEKQNYEVNIAVAKDKAFAFHYNENIEILKKLGANIHYFSPLQDTKLPDKCDGIYIVGGYPEVFAEQLSKNILLMKEIKNKAENNIPIYGECGGYMYLHESITTLDDKTYKMVGIFKGRAYMKKRLQNFGYTTVEGIDNTILFDKGMSFRAHEFHRSIVDREDKKYYIKASKGDKEWNCGKIYNNVYGMYPHIYFPSNIAIAEKFIKSMAEVKKTKKI
ncbi:MAG: cobyrinate a,c-diamide synthase [Vallitalea sp.]|jgi:cobyrinic acid a,c-diamide synthase|nr:cobyrinate a,c-diamide synthase [Vallitalea sp.]